MGRREYGKEEVAAFPADRFSHDGVDDEMNNLRVLVEALIKGAKTTVGEHGLLILGCYPNA